MRILSAAFLSLAACMLIAGQTYQGRILGIVSDEKGAVIRGGRVTITNTETGFARTVETTDAGDYVAANLPPGLYSVVAEATGFKKVQRPSIRVEVAKDVRIDITLIPGDISEAVTITDEAPLVETTNNV